MDKSTCSPTKLCPGRSSLSASLASYAKKKNLARKVTAHRPLRSTGRRADRSTDAFGCSAQLHTTSFFFLYVARTVVSKHVQDRVHVQVKCRPGHLAVEHKRTEKRQTELAPLEEATS